MLIKLKINGIEKTVDVAADELLSTTLREAGYTGLKRGCQDGSCGACTVLLDGVAIRSCLLFTAQAEGHEVTTIEGLGTIDSPHPLQEIFVRKGAVQCGFCIPGMILSAKALLDENRHPNRTEVAEAIDGNLCRCTGYVKQIEAVLAAAEAMDEGGEP